MSLPLTLGNTLTLYYVNATSLAKTHAVQHLHSEIFANRVDVALIAESWFSARHLDADVAVDGYLLFRRDRFQRKGGGVCAYVDARLSCKLFRPCVNHNLVEILWLKVCSETELYFIACAYHPPKPKYDSKVFHNELAAGIDAITHLYPSSIIVIAGDFNQLDTCVFEVDNGLSQLVDSTTCLIRYLQTGLIYTMHIVLPVSSKPNTWQSWFLHRATTLMQSSCTDPIRLRCMICVVITSTSCIIF